MAGEPLSTDESEVASRLGLAAASARSLSRRRCLRWIFPKWLRASPGSPRAGGPRARGTGRRRPLDPLGLDPAPPRAAGGGAAIGGGAARGPRRETGLPATRAADLEALAGIAEEIPELDELARGIFRIVDRDGQVKEREIPELRGIAARIQSLRGDVVRLASTWLADPDRRAWWQSDRPTVKDGRTVLAVKANFRGRVAGIVHESSASGATVYVEPADIVEKNNQITLQRSEYDRELLRILREECAKLAVRQADLRRLVREVAALDVLHARARYAVVHRCSPALPSAGGIVLAEARHPLLGGRAIPIEVRLSADVRTLIITGPNTGGKTVSPEDRRACWPP